jgi:hypothetical protein
MHRNDFNQKAGFDVDAATSPATTPKFGRVSTITVIYSSYGDMTIIH